MPLFVLLEHCWEGVHWDLMFEDGPGLRTWSFNEPIRHGVVIEARPRPGHRRLYLDYEGEISGGRGTVRRIDRGEYETLVWSETLVRAKLNGRQLVGEVELRKVEAGPAERPLEVWDLRLGNLD